MPAQTTSWVTVCDVDDLAADAGICAIVNGIQVAIFSESYSARLYAVSNYDPIGRAFVMSRGILGSLADACVVASPLYKQHFDLETGACIEQPEFRLDVYPARVARDSVQIQVRR